MTHRKYYQRVWHYSHTQKVPADPVQENVWQSIRAGAGRVWSKLSEVALPLVRGDQSAHLEEGSQSLPLSTGLGSLLSGLNWDGVRDEVDRESRSRIVIAGAAGCGKSTLLNTLKATQVSPVSDLRSGVADTTKVEDFGLFSLVTVAPCTPGMQAASDSSIPEQSWLALSNADQVMWLLDGREGLRTWEHEWICRIRAASKPLLVALNTHTGVTGQACSERLEQTLGCAVISFSAQDIRSTLNALLPKIVQTCDKLNTPLGREVPVWRSHAAQHTISRAATISGLIGAEPVPLLDIPFQVMIQLRAVLRLAAIYGESQDGPYSRELLATLVAGAGLRIAGQQLTKVIPIVGWLCSGLFAAGGTWLMGKAAQQYFAQGRNVSLPHLSVHVELGRAARSNQEEHLQ